MSYKQLHLAVNENTITISHTEELDNRKSELYVGQRQSENIQHRLKAIHDDLKANKNYKGVELGFGEIDWYDSCDSFEVPYFVIRKGDRKVKVLEETYNDIPKDWTQETTIRFDRPKQYAIIIKALKNFMSIDDKREKEIKKCIKANNDYFIEL